MGREPFLEKQEVLTLSLLLAPGVRMGTSTRESDRQQGKRACRVPPTYISVHFSLILYEAPKLIGQHFHAQRSVLCIRTPRFRLSLPSLS